MRRTAPAFFLLAAALAGSSAPGLAQSSSPKLILVLSIDQMRFDYLSRFNPLYRSGLRTLLDRGAVFSKAMYRHAATETGPGHSVILTGRHPSHSGIVANEWYDAYLGKILNVVDDPAQRALGGSGRGASPVNALGPTVGDLLKAKTPASKVVGVSLKDRSAVLMGGHRADGAYWFDTASGHFVTSTYYMRDAPSWLASWNDRHLPDQYGGKTWTRLLPDPAVYERYAGKDAVDGEWDRQDTVFPHAIRGNPPAQLFYDDLQRTPFADDLTLDVALRAMHAHHIGEDAVTDILAVGFSATDFVGHTYGPDSQEAMDQLLRLDQVLGKLFAEIDARVGLRNTLIVLTADHGAEPLVENLQARGLPAQRALPIVLENAVRSAFGRRFPGADALISRYAPPDFYLNERMIRDRHLARREVEDTAIAALVGTGLVSKVYTHDDLRGANPSPADPFLQLFQNGFFESRSPQLTVLLKQYVYLSTRVGGTGHGTAYEDDRHVPIVFMGSGIKPGFYDAPCGPEDIAPTLAHMLDLPLEREDDARLLNEMLTGR